VKFLIIHYADKRLLFLQLAYRDIWSSFAQLRNNAPRCVRIYSSCVDSHVEIRCLNRIFHRHRSMCRDRKIVLDTPLHASILVANYATRRWFQSAIFSCCLITLAWQGLTRKSSLTKRVTFVASSSRTRHRTPEIFWMLEINKINKICTCLCRPEFFNRCATAHWCALKDFQE